MTENTGNTTPKAQWRWDRFNARTLTSAAWASRNCIGTDNAELRTHQAMQQRVLQEQKSAELIITSELHQLLRNAANITSMTYCCKLTQHTLACINSKDIRQSWLQDGSDANLKRFAWMFYYYGSEIHKFGMTLTHGEWIERKVLASLHVTYVYLGDLPTGQRTCVQQLYSKKMNDLRSNIMRRTPTFQHTSMVKKEQPKIPGLFKKHFKRGKATFFVNRNIRDQTTWHKVCYLIVNLTYQGGNLHFICMLTQVDYSKDEQWHAWNQEALKRFLNRNEQPSYKKTMVPYNGQGQGRGPEPNVERVQETWWPSSTNRTETTTPLFLEEKPDLFDLEDVFAECNQVVALEDDMWNLETVSAKVDMTMCVLGLVCLTNYLRPLPG
jgi:hypothetical protein